MTPRPASSLGRRAVLLLAGGAALATPRLVRAQPDAIRIGEVNSYTAQPAFLQPYRNAWLLAQEAIVIPKTAHAERVQENATALDSNAT